MKITITNLETKEKMELIRDVQTTHPAWVHDQCGTENEGELQRCLDCLNVEMWYKGDHHLGPDVSGLEMFRD